MVELFRPPGDNMVELFRPPGDNMVELFRPPGDNMVQRMHFACWITQATDTLSDYVILIAFQGNNTYTNAHQCYIIHRFSVTFVIFFGPSRQCQDITSK